MKIEYIYLLQEEEFVKKNEHIFKIGKIKLENYEIFYEFPDESILLLQSSCNDCDALEKKIIKLFKEKYIYRKDIGNEYFEGNYELMKKDINKNIEEEYLQKKFNKSIKNKLDNIFEKNNNDFVDTPECMKVNIRESTKIEDNISLIDNDFIEKEEILKKENLSYFKCQRCEYVSKQKINMIRHLTRVNKCTILNNYKNKAEYQLYRESLIPLNLDNKIKEKNFCCERCEYKCSDKSNLSKHMKNSKRCKRVYEESMKNNTNSYNTSNNTNNSNNTINNTITNNSNNTQNISIANNNNININVKSLRGFEEEWNTSNITTEMKKNLLLGHSKFTNTLKSILTNDENLNVILKDESTGIVYKFKNDEYEAMHVNDILDISMDKIYKHLKDFVKEIINIDNKTIINEIDNEYCKYKKDFKIKKVPAIYLVDIFNENKDKSIEKFVEKIHNVSTTNNDNQENKKLEDLY